MKLELWVIGKTNEKYLTEGMALYEKRIRRYLPFKMEIIPDVKYAKNLPSTQLRIKEGALVLKRIKKEDYLILLDENGPLLNSKDFAQYLEKKFVQSQKRILFLVGGAFGFSPQIYDRANAKLSLSKMTFSHQMIRLFFLEQLYRAMTILRNEPYHNE